MNRTVQYLVSRQTLGGMTLRELAACFLYIRKKQIKATTYSNLKGVVFRFCDFIGSSKLVKSISIDDFERWANSIQIGISAGHYNKQIRNIRSMFSFCDDFFSYKSPGAFRLVKIKSSFSDYKDYKIYTFDQFKLFISSVSDPLKKALFETMFYLGLRMGELRGLEWPDIENGILTVNRSVSSKLGTGKAELLDPKSASSHRSLPLPLFLQEDLATLKATSRSVFVFAKREKEPIGETTIERYIKKQAARAGLYYIKPHNFRHSCASYLYNDLSLDIFQISKWLGHANVSITSKIYVHLFLDKRQNIAAAIEKEHEKPSK